MLTTDAQAQAQQQQQQQQQHMLTDLSLGALARSGFSTAALRDVSPQVRTRVVVAAVVGHLINIGVIDCPDPRALAWAPLTLPDHLRPDVDEILAGVARARTLLPGKRVSS